MYPNVFEGETNRVTIAIHAMKNRKQAGVLYISKEQMSEVRNRMKKREIEQNTVEMIIDDRGCMSPSFRYLTDTEYRDDGKVTAVTKLKR
jgi:hypothetical protein